MSQPWVGRVSGKWVISVARALRTPDGKFAGVVHANLSSERFARRFATVDVGQDGAIALRTGKLALVARVTQHGPATDGLGVGAHRQRDQRLEQVAQQRAVVRHADGTPA